MRHFLIPLTVVSFLIVSLARGLTAEEKVYDVVVYGGTSAAVIAAQQTALMGKSVIVVSPDKHLGGLSSGGLGATDSGKQDAIGGLAKGFYHRLWQHYQADDAWTFEPKPEAMEGQGG
ncbi:MAG: FAD-dependent oxidoreductase, partial [Thermoguttaceae bacterium]|nr:FAD-dependent oxidoreductase [Thermoguttaceae bacterium]